MFLLIHSYLGRRDVKGVFPSVHMAKKYVVRVMRREVEWSESSPVSGIISADSGDGYLTIEPGRKTRINNIHTKNARTGH